MQILRWPVNPVDGDGDGDGDGDDVRPWLGCWKDEESRNVRPCAIAAMRMEVDEVDPVMYLYELQVRACGAGWLWGAWGWVEGGVTLLTNTHSHSRSLDPYIPTKGIPY